jgi:hypothetical protein
MGIAQVMAYCEQWRTVLLLEFAAQIFWRDTVVKSLR